MKHFFDQIKKLVQEATATNDRSGRASDEKRTFVNAVLLATASTPTAEINQDKATTSSSSVSAAPSQRVLFDLIGINSKTGQKKMKRLEDQRRAIRQGLEESDWSLIVSRDEFWQKVSDKSELQLTSGSGIIIM